MTGSTKFPSSMLYIILGLFGLYTLELGVVGILPEIVERFGVTVAQAGLLMGLFALIVAVSGPFLVLFSSRYDRKKILTLSLFGFAICSALSAYAPDFTTLMALRVVPAMLHPVFFSAAFAAAVSLYPKERAAHATTTAFIGTTLGLVFGVPITTFVAATFSYEGAFLFCSIATGLAGLGLLLKLPTQVNAERLSFGRQLSVFRKPSVWLAIAATILVFTAKFSVYSYAAEYLRSETAMDGKTISVMLVLFGVGGVSGNLLAGRLLSKSLVMTVLFHPIVLAIAYLILYAFGSASITSMTIITLAWGAVHTSGMVITQSWMSAAAPEAPEFATSLYVSAANGGIALGAWVGGLFINAIGMSGTIWCGLIFTVLSLIVIAIRAALFGAHPDRETWRRSRAIA
jgi:predicted MFS family arabinose efflux permease